MTPWTRTRTKTTPEPAQAYEDQLVTRYTVAFTLGASLVLLALIMTAFGQIPGLFLLLPGLPLVAWSSTRAFTRETDIAPRSRT